MAGTGVARGASGERLREEAIDDATFLQVINAHLNFDAVTRQNAYAIHAHASGQVALEDMIGCFFTRHADLEHRIGKAFFHNADEFDDVLGHRKGNEAKEPKQSTE